MAEQHEQKLGTDGGAKKEVDIALLSQAMEAFNEATIKLQSSYELLQDEARKLREEIEDKNRELSYMSNLLESVLNNTRSSIILINSDGNIVMKNLSGEKLLDELGEAFVMDMLSSMPEDEGVADYDNGNDRFFRLSSGQLATGDIKGTVFVIDDITNIKKFEMEKQQGERLQLMGEMVANIAHEIRNPLGSMELYATFLERDLADTGQKRYANNIIKAIRIINGTISNTLLFTKEMKPQKQTYVLADIVDEVILYLQHALKEKRVTIVNKLDENHMVSCQKDLFRQVVMNIVHNAIDAVAEEGQVTIGSEESDGWLRLYIRDNGCGIRAENRSKLFLPFQTTKAKGTGLGLSIAYKIVKAHDGDITMDSDGASFTEFVIHLQAPR